MPKKSKKPIFFANQEPVIIPKESDHSFFRKSGWYFLVLMLLLSAGLVFCLWKLLPLAQKQRQAKLALPSLEPTATVAPTDQQDELTETLKQQSSSDELTAIEKDLRETDFGGLDQELEAIDQELTNE